MLLEDKVCLVTGGSRGIGRSIVELLAQHGAKVVFTYLKSATQAQETIESLQNVKHKPIAMQSDASSFEASSLLIDEIIKTYQQLDVLVNNAGLTQDNLILRMTEEQWDIVIQSNLKSIFNLSKHATKPMLKQRKGSIINITSIVGMQGQAGQINYAASKSGIIGFTKSLAQELGSRNIRCNAIAPGFIETEMTVNLSEESKSGYLKNIPLQRFGSALEVAQVVLFLASDLSSYVNGQTLAVCGGLER